MRFSIIFLLLLVSLASAQEPAQPNIPPAATAPGATNTDDRYRFATGFSTEQQIQLERTAEGVVFKWPHTPDSDTVILGIRSWGAEAEPWVEISSWNLSIQQYFDSNASGLRWINLS